MRETVIEKYLVKQVRANKGQCWKWISPGRIGVPDRIVLMPNGVVAFVETKAPGKTERASQEYVQDKMRNLGCLVFSSVDSKARVDEVVTRLVATCTREVTMDEV